jgi:hypothetical protein
VRHAPSMRTALPLVLHVLLVVGAPAPALAQCVAAHGEIIALGCDPVRISRDDGRTFADTGLTVDAVTVTEDGRVYAASRDEPPSLFEVGGALREALPVASVSALGSVGRTIVAVGPAAGDDPSDEGEHLVLVRDASGVRELGRVQLASYAIELSVAGTEREPRAEVLNHVGLSCWGTVAVRRFSIDRRGVRAASLLDDDACAHGEGSCARMGDLEGGAHGSAYARSAGPEGSVLAGPVLLVRPGEHTTPTNLRLEAEASLSVAHNGALTFALSEGALYRLEGVRATRLRGTIDADAHLVYVDPRGRPFAETLGGVMLRYSRRSGWAPLR